MNPRKSNPFCTEMWTFLQNNSTHRLNVFSNFAWELLSTPTDYDWNDLPSTTHAWGFTNQTFAKQAVALFAQMRNEKDKDYEVYQQLMSLREPIGHTVTFTTSFFRRTIGFCGQEKHSAN